MMLHRDLREIESARRILRGQILRMQVVRDAFGINAEETAHVLDGPFEHLHGFEILEVPDMLAEDRVMLARETERVLQFAAAREDLLDGRGEIDRMRRVSARAPDHAVAAFERAHDRVIRWHVDAPVVREEVLGESVQPRRDLFVAACDWLLGQVAGGHDQRIVRRAFEQQMMQRRIRQH